MYNSNMNWAPMNNAPFTDPYRAVAPSGNRIGYSPQQQNVTGNILKAAGPESAKAYPSNPGTDSVLFDANEPIFYFVSKDDSGFPTLRTFKFEEVFPEKQATQENSEDILKLKDELGSVKNEISELKELLKGLVD